jgi:hypothetical protein
VIDLVVSNNTEVLKQAIAEIRWNTQYYEKIYVIRVNIAFLNLGIRVKGARNLFPPLYCEIIFGTVPQVLLPLLCEMIIGCLFSHETENKLENRQPA